MRKLLVIPFLFFIFSGLVSCSSSDEPIYFYQKQPAKVNAVTEKSAEIITVHGNFLVNNLNEEDLNILKEIHLLTATFVVDMNDQSNEGVKTATGFSYIPVNSSLVIIPGNKDEFDAFLENAEIDSISSAKVYTEYIDSLAFFEFTHKDPGKVYSYNLIFNPDTGSENIEFYIQPKEIDTAVYPESSVMEHKYIVYAFDISKFIKMYKTENPEAKSVKLAFKYKSKAKEYTDVPKSFEFSLTK